MSYKETLTKMIKESGLSLAQISIKCKELYNVPVDPSYISKLKSPNQAPASDDVNSVIAKACGGDPEELIFEAYMEKAPELVKKLISGMAHMIRQSAIKLFDNNLPQNFIDLMTIEINQLSDRGIIESAIKSDVINNFEIYDKDNTFFLKNENEPGGLKLIVNPYTGITMPDNSMQPVIPQGVALIIRNTDELKSGSIVVVADEDNNYTIRRYIELGDNKFILTADNGNYRPILETEDLRIVGIVRAFQNEVN